MAPQISVIIVNYNSGARLARCVACLKTQTLQDFETIIVDNASTDGSADFARADSAVTLIDAGANLGFAAANNLAAKSAKGAWLAFLNPDAYAQDDWLAEFAAAAARHPEIDAFGSTQLDAANPDIIDGAGDAYHAFGLAWRGCHGLPVSTLPPEGECFAHCGAAAFYRKPVFETLGGFEERFFCYAEDADLGFKLRLAGGGAIQAPKSVVLHEGSGVTGKASDFTVYHGHRNRIWAYALNMPMPLLIATLPFHLLVNLYLVVRFSISGGVKSYLRAVKDAVKGLPEIWALRHGRQRGRKASVAEIARALTWSPMKVMRREADIRDRMKRP